MTDAHHPGFAAVALHSQYAGLRATAVEKRTTAAALRREAKACTLKVEAAPLRAKAKSISNEAATAARQANSTLLAFMEKSAEAQQILTQRMPTPQWKSWGVVKTRVYKNLLAVVTTQLTRTHPKASLISGSLQHLLNHASWGDKHLQSLSVVKPTTKELPQL